MTTANSNKFSKAFTLIELAIVLTVIALIIVATIRGASLIKSSQVTNGRSITLNSVVKDLPDLVAWYETSLQSSFKTQEGVNNQTISIWYDNNPSSLARNKEADQSKSTSAYQNTNANKPLFIEKAFNSTLPAVRFDGSDDFLNIPFAGSNLIGKNYTIFIVEQRRSKVGLYFFGRTAGDFFLGYSDTQKIKYKHTNDLEMDLSAEITLEPDLTPIPKPKPRIHTASFNSSAGIKYWLNGGTATSGNDNSQTTALSGSSSIYVAKSENDKYFNGDIAEIIIFKRVLKTEERQAVEDYLSKKYNITIS